jgi:thiamine-phosphate pyrophosphorylase
MKHFFTPASQRALDFASGWAFTSDYSELAKLSGPALLLGLLSETECRASRMLAEAGISTEAVLTRWPGLSQVEISSDQYAYRGTQSLSEEVQLSLELVQQRLSNLPQPLELATEHILFGLTITGRETAAWLLEQGVDLDSLNTEIQTMYSPRRPISWALEMEPETPSIPNETPTGHPITEHPIQPAPHAAEDCQVAMSEVAVLRVLDAAANRAQEGFRVVEDYVRFVLDDRHLTHLCKQMRHDMTAALVKLPEQHRLAARETQADVGVSLTTESERRRDDASQVLAANFSRLQESIRSLEEFGKTVDADMAAAFKQLRYRVYTFQRAVNVTRVGIERLADAKLYVLIDGRSSVEEFQQLASSLIAAGVDVLQLRDKKLDDRTLLERARLLRELTAENKTLMIVNDRPDLAALAYSDGVHVGQEELSVKDARTIVGPAALIGVSTHSIEQARKAVLDGADYIGVGPTFPSDTKQFEHFPGIDLLKAVAIEIRLPAFAIGGIHRENIGEVLAAGFTRVAVSGAVSSAPDPAEAVKKLLRAMKSH